MTGRLGHIKALTSLQCDTRCVEHSPHCFKYRKGGLFVDFRTLSHSCHENECFPKKSVSFQVGQGSFVKVLTVLYFLNTRYLLSYDIWKLAGFVMINKRWVCSQTP